jgi:predicted Zn-dependent protease
VAFLELDARAVAHAMAMTAEREGDVGDVYFERLEEVEVPPEGNPLGLRVWREEGLAVRLVRGQRTWIASRDSIDSAAFSHALRQVARVLPRAMPTPPRITARPWSEPAEAPELPSFAAEVERLIRASHTAFPLQLWTRRHRRSLQIIGKQLVPDEESESFFSCWAELPWGSFGTLLPELDEQAARTVADVLMERFLSRHAPTPEPFTGVVVLGPSAAAVFFHEAVAHTLEADTLALTGVPDGAIGVQLAAPNVDLLDNPAGGPIAIRRLTDDEGVPVVRRWLLRRGVVEQILADLRWAGDSGVLTPGAARRANRHLAPGPRSTHLELVPGDVRAEELLEEADGGLFLAAASRGNLDPFSGVFSLEVPCGRRIRHAELAERVGPLTLRGRVFEMLQAVTAASRTAHLAGAGWCAKGGQRLPVWATMPSVRLEGIEVSA